MTTRVVVTFDYSAFATAFPRRYLISHSSFPDPGLHHEMARVIARRTWEDRTRAEYIGVQVMHRIWALSVDLGAPMDIQQLALRMMLDEQQHAEACARAAASFGSDGEIEIDLLELQSGQSTDLPPAMQFLEAVIRTLLVGETVALKLLQHTVRELPSSPYRDLLKGILRDEVHHAAAGARLLNGLRSSDSFLDGPIEANALPLLGASIHAMRGRDVVEPVDIEAFHADPGVSFDLLRSGVSSPLKFKSAYHVALDELEREWTRILTMPPT